MSSASDVDVNGDTLMRIGELSLASGVSPRSLRYYGEQGLLHSERNAVGHRRYRRDTIERVELIQALFSAGLSSITIAELLPCIEGPVEARSATLFRRLRAERRRVDDRVHELQRVGDRLDGIIESLRPTSPR